MKTSSKGTKEDKKVEQGTTSKDKSLMTPRERSLSNLKPAKKGEIRNPTGTNKMIKDTLYVKSELQRILKTEIRNKKGKGTITRLESFLINLVDQGHKNPNFAKMVMEYTFGRPAQEVHTRDLTLEDIFSKALKQFDKSDVIDVDSEEVK